MSWWINLFIIDIWLQTGYTQSFNPDKENLLLWWIGVGRRASSRVAENPSRLKSDRCWSFATGTADCTPSRVHPALGRRFWFVLNLLFIFIYQILVFFIYVNIDSDQISSLVSNLFDFDIYYLFFPLFFLIDTQRILHVTLYIFSSCHRWYIKGNPAAWGKDIWEDTIEGIKMKWKR